MPHFLQNRPQRFLLPRQFPVQKFLPPRDLLLENSRPCLPRQRHPRQKRRPLALRRPFLLFQSLAQSVAALRRSLKHAPFRPRRWLIALSRAHKTRRRQFFQRIINLRPRNPRPIPHAPPLQLKVRLVPMHPPLRQQAQQNQIRRSQRAPLLLSHPSPFSLFLCVRLRFFLRLCLITSLLLYVALLPPSAPIPPLALLRRQSRIPRLRHRRPKGIQNANILMLPRHPSQLPVKPFRILSRKLCHAPHPEQLKIPQHRRTHRDQIPKTP